MSAKLTPEVELQEHAIRNWYDQFVSVRLNFGRELQSMQKVQTDSEQKQRVRVRPSPI